MFNINRGLRVCRPKTTRIVPPTFLNKSLWLINNLPREVIETHIRIKIIEKPNTNPKDLYKVKSLDLP